MKPEKQLKYYLSYLVVLLLWINHDWSPKFPSGEDWKEQV